MAAALAHELNQPLTSLVSCARATQLLVQRLERSGDAATEQIVDVTRKLATAAMRAGEVVKRVRDFFRQRGTQLQNTDLGILGEPFTPWVAADTACVLAGVRLLAKAKATA